jgi:hypothetical protein
MSIIPMNSTTARIEESRSNPNTNATQWMSTAIKANKY